VMPGSASSIGCHSPCSAQSSGMLGAVVPRRSAEPSQLLRVELSPAISAAARRKCSKPPGEMIGDPAGGVVRVQKVCHWLRGDAGRRPRRERRRCPLCPTGPRGRSATRPRAMDTRATRVFGGIETRPAEPAPVSSAQAGGPPYYREATAFPSSGDDARPWLASEACVRSCALVSIVPQSFS
jgi:hypothetical protein